MANQQEENSKEIDLTQFSRHIKRFYGRVGNSFYNTIVFIKRNIIIIAALFIIGGVLGYFMDKGSKSYENKLLVTPNFKSTDYLYEQVDLLNEKIMSGDTVFLKSLGIKNTKKISKIEIEPVTDLYAFINENENLYEHQPDSKYEVFRIMADKGDLTKVVEDPTISKYYKYHLITFKTSRQANNSEFAEPILKYLNSSPYFADVQKEFIKSVEQKMVVNDSTIAQINRILNEFSKNKAGNTVFYNESTDLSKLIHSKSLLLKEQEQNRVSKIDYTHIIKDNAVLLNIKKKGLPMKVILPIVFILLFTVVVRFRRFYKRHSVRREAAV